MICHWCAKPLTDKEKTRDHVIPICFYRRGLVKMVHPLRTAVCCYNCNEERSAMTSRIFNLHDLVYDKCLSTYDRVVKLEEEMVERLGSNFVEWIYV